MRNYRYILWDWNGTLFNDVSLCHEIANEILGQQGIPAQTLEQYRHDFEFPVVHYYQKMGWDFSVMPNEALSEHFIRTYESRRHSCGLHEGAVKILEKIKESYVLTILSAYQHDTLQEVLHHHGIHELFETCQGNRDIYAPGKIEVAHNLLNLLPVEGGDCLMIGDTIHDCEVAEQLGADCLLVAHGHQSERRLQSAGQPIVHSLQEVYDWLEG